MKNLKGVHTALVTPFKNGEVDMASFTKLVEFQLESNVDGFVINGTTGESPSLEKEEVKKLFHRAKEIVGNDKAITLGTGSNSTQKTIETTKWAEGLGADAALIVVPYYNKPPQEGLCLHFKEVAKATKLPVLLYNVPGRTITSLSLDSVVELSQVQNIVGIKEASGDLGFAKEISNQCKDFLLLSGDDASCVDLIERGGVGVISVISHLIPKELKTFFTNDASSEEYSKFNRLNQLLGIEANPIPVKMALSLMGIIESPELRLPLRTLAKEHQEELKKCLTEIGLIHG